MNTLSDAVFYCVYVDFMYLSYQYYSIILLVLLVYYLK